MWEAYGERVSGAWSSIRVLLTSLFLTGAVFGGFLARSVLKVAVVTGVALAWVYVIIAVRVGEMRSRWTAFRRRA